MPQSKAIEAVGNDTWILKVLDKDGKSTSAETFKGDKAADAKSIGSLLVSEFKRDGSRRNAWQSMLASVFKLPMLDGYRGTGDRTTGKTSKEFKAAIRSAEESYLREMVKEGHIKLAKSDNPEDTFQQFATQVREDKNYSNLKSTVSKYFAFVGANCVTQADILIPVAIMQAQIQSVLDIKKEPDTVRAKLAEIKAFMDKGTIESDDAIDSLAAARALVETLDGIVKHYAELRTNASIGPGSVVQSAVVAIAKAKEEPALV